MSLNESSDSDRMHYCACESEVEDYVEKQRQNRKLLQKQLEEKRRLQFKKMWENKNEGMFHLEALQFTQFHQFRIRFKFLPRRIVQYISINTKFDCILSYDKQYNFWKLRKNNFPHVLLPDIYGLTDRHHVVRDKDLNAYIEAIYDFLETFSQWYSKKRLKKREDYLRNPHYLKIDEEDEELFLTAEEVEAVHAKQNEVRRRLLPPERRNSFVGF